MNTRKTPPAPLPRDYYELSSEGRRLARVNAVACRHTPDLAVQAWNFFRQYYLNHDQAFFYKGFAESPQMHLDFVRFWSMYRLNAIAAPRGTSKSTVIGKEFPLMEILTPSIPGIEIGVLLAKDSFIEERFDDLMFQLKENPRIREDFGRLNPTKGDGGKWSLHYFKTLTNVKVKGFSIEGRKRGARPDMIIVDDPEFDPSSSTNLDAVSQGFRDTLFREIFGMMTPKTRMFWIGTLLHRKAFLYELLTSHDPQYRLWNRRIYSVETVDAKHGTVDPYGLWPARFTKEFLDFQRAAMGEGAYRAEYCNDPRSDQDAVLALDPVLTEYHLKDHNGERPQESIDPLRSEAEIYWTEVTDNKDGTKEFSEKSAKFCEHISTMSRFMTVDFASTTFGSSDYSAIVVMGLDSKNTLWVLDAWHKRCRSNELITKIHEIGKRWQVKTIGIESVSVQDEFRQRVQDFMGLALQGSNWIPRIRGIRYKGGTDTKSRKPERISSLEWRFTRGRIKLPSYYRKGAHSLCKLVEQIQDFTPDLSRLPHDDLVDALAMIHYMISGAASPTLVGKTDPSTWEERILSGEFHMKEFPMINLLSAKSPSEWSVDVVHALERHKADEEYDTTLSKTVLGCNDWGPYVDPEDFERNYE